MQLDDGIKLLKLTTSIKSFSGCVLNNVDNVQRTSDNFIQDQVVENNGTPLLGDVKLAWPAIKQGSL